ncbi:hypothetical protein ACFSW8_09835 [Rubritalea tangerina]|uniref:Uncharacterized protein n=1 Tax=Rubritalea tangerina TaxID=430798 RepID=A0ABW4ZBG9_9BACT
MPENLPPHLKISSTVTDEEYNRAKRQSIIVWSVALGFGSLTGLIAFYTLGGIRSLIIAGVVGTLLERVMNSILKDAHKTRTLRLKRYPELKKFREVVEQNNTSNNQIG